MKLAIYQGPSANGEVEAAFGRLERLLRAAAEDGAQMLLVPELFLPGYNRPDLHHALAQSLDGPWMLRASELCSAAGCGLTLGWCERAGDSIYNSATTFDAEGRRLGHYRKIQLFGPMERKSFASASPDYTVFSFIGVKIGLLICYDVEFYGHVAALAAKGAKLVLVPTANPAGYEHVQQVLIPARAYEQRLTIAYANYCGSEAGLVYSGRSLIAGPDAKPLLSAGTGETLLIADLSTVDSIPESLLSTQHRDWRG